MNGQVPALLGFGASAWQVAPRDTFIGWEHDQRRRGLPLIVNNARFLILPWVQSKNLASKILAMIARQLPIDWFSRYKIQPVLMDTFVESCRYLLSSCKLDSCRSYKRKGETGAVWCAKRAGEGCFFIPTDSKF